MRQYFLMSNVPGQPFASIRVRLVSGDVATDRYVVVACADIRIAGSETITSAANLRPLEIWPE